MIVSKIVNHYPAEGSISELTVRGLAIGISESLNGKDWTRLQFDIRSVEDIECIIKALSRAADQLKSQQEPIKVSSKFSIMRQMLAESGGDKL